MEICGRIQPEKYVMHADVYEYSEAEGYGNLQQEHPQVVFKVAACHHKWLEHHEQDVEHDGPFSDGEGGEHAQYVCHAGNWRRAQGGSGNKGYPKRIHKQRNTKQKITSEKKFVHMAFLIYKIAAKFNLKSIRTDIKEQLILV